MPSITSMSFITTEDSLESVTPSRSKRWTRRAPPRASILEDGAAANRLWIAHFMDAGSFDLIMSIVIVFNVVVIIIDTDKVASCITEGLDPIDNECTSTWLTIANLIMLSMYTTEAGLRIYAYRCRFFQSNANLLDFFIVTGGWIDLLFTEVIRAALPSSQALKAFRLCRLMRAVRLLGSMPELFSMIRGFVGAIKSMLWGFIMLLVLLTIWGILCVELLHPVSVQTWFKYSECDGSMSTVMLAILYLFQTLVALDSWGQCAVPIVVKAPWTIIPFFGSFICVSLGFTNLILSVVVTRAANETKHDIDAREKEIQAKRKEARERLLKLLKQIDVDGSGTISLVELLQGYDDNEDLRTFFNILGIDPDDLPLILQCFDEDKNGELSYEEFINSMHRAETGNHSLHQIMTATQVNKIAKCFEHRNMRNHGMGNLAHGFSHVNSLSASQPAMAMCTTGSGFGSSVGVSSSVAGMSSTRMETGFDRKAGTIDRMGKLDETGVMQADGSSSPTRPTVRFDHVEQHMVQTEQNLSSEIKCLAAEMRRAFARVEDRLKVLGAPLGASLGAPLGTQMKKTASMEDAIFGGSLNLQHASHALMTLQQQQQQQQQQGQPQSSLSYRLLSTTTVAESEAQRSSRADDDLDIRDLLLQLMTFSEKTAICMEENSRKADANTIAMKKLSESVSLLCGLSSAGLPPESCDQNVGLMSLPTRTWEPHPNNGALHARVDRPNGGPSCCLISAGWDLRSASRPSALQPTVHN